LDWELKRHCLNRLPSRRKPHWVSGSITSAACVKSRLGITLAKILPPTGNSEMPRLLPQSARSPLFLYMATILASFRRSVGGQYKRYKIVWRQRSRRMLFPPDQLETLAADRKGWRDVCTIGMLFMQATQDKTEDERHRRRHEHAARNREKQLRLSVSHLWPYMSIKHRTVKPRTIPTRKIRCRIGFAISTSIEERLWKSYTKNEYNFMTLRSGEANQLMHEFLKINEKLL